MREQAVDVRWIVRDLRVVPIMRMARRAQHAGGDCCGRLVGAARQQQRVFPPALLQRVINQDMHGMFGAARNHHAQRIDHAALADAQSLCGQIVIGNLLDELYCFSRDCAGL